MFKFFSSLLIALIWAFSCTANQPALPVPTQAVRLDENHTLLLLDSAASARVLLQDQTDRFFELVTASEMSIQIKKPLEDGQTREDLLPEFMDYLRRDVEAFSEEEAQRTTAIVQGVFKTCWQVAQNIFPDTLILIKTKGKHYGRSVYYTRENTIVIPADALAPSNTANLESTIYHELFHVYSRLNPEKRRRLYKLIGFEGIGLQNLQMPEGLAARVLYNPDGVDFAQRISLTLDDGSSIDAIPVLYSGHLGYKPGRSTFFAYVAFDLYQIQQTAAGKWQVITKDDGFSSTLNLRELPDFFRQIKDNTGYIIHPDEVLADNFTFLMREKNKPDANAKFSEEGKKLLVDIEAVLRGEAQD
ncbi:MAG: hypothetical protein R3D58_05240 [Saprospiraceae bacterium]